jgi:hypothetical protein
VPPQDGGQVAVMIERLANAPPDAAPAPSKLVMKP